jgi:nucleoid DNA-binding protein
MGKKKKDKSRIKSIISEIAYDLGIDKKLVRQVLLFTFKEIAITLIFKGRPVMIRRFAKFVVALAEMKKIKKTKQKETSE